MQPGEAFTEDPVVPTRLLADEQPLMGDRCAARRTGANG